MQEGLVGLGCPLNKESNFNTLEGIRNFIVCFLPIQYFRNNKAVTPNDSLVGSSIALSFLRKR